MKKLMEPLRNISLSVIAGAVLFGVAVNMFLLPQGIVTGGATGIATAAGKLFGLPVGLGIILVNLPIFAVCIRESGIGGLVYSIIGTLLTSVTADGLVFLPAATDDPLLCALIGGAIMGAGAGMMLVSGYTTGGTDLAAHMIHRRHPRLSTGRMILFFDAAVIVLAAVAMGNFAGIMYSAICTVSYSAALDMIQSTSRRARMFFVISDKHEEIAAAVSERIDRGVTLLRGTGYYTGSEKQVIMCVTGKQEEFPLRQLVLEIDPGAFMVIGDATGVAGKGFGELH